MLFGFLLAVLVAITLDLAFRQLSVSVLERRLDLGMVEARDIARIVSDVGRDDSGIDFSLVRERGDYLQDVIHRRISMRVFVHHVEVVDRFGIQQLFVANTAFQHEPPRVVPDLSFPEDWPKSFEQIVQWPLTRSEGMVKLGVSSQPILDELSMLRSSLRKKLMLGAALALALLVAGFFYVLYLLRKNRRLEHARQSAARASYVGLLASGLAHEIRNPLNAMSMNLQMLEEELQGVELAEHDDLGELLESTKSEIQRLESLVNNFLAYARPSPPRLASRNLNGVVREVLKFLEVDFRQSKVELRSELEPLLPDTEIDDTQFKQALLNLLVNARQVLSAGGVVTVRTRAGARGEIVLEVEDDGPGIPREMRERIFEVFYSSRGGGTGLGLPIARQIIERHGGTIELDSEEGRGTRFTIHLPRHHARGEPASPPAERGPEAATR
ncbi:MAG TPA: ATP-binding protein [Candidatus Polarisedimenticolaceae bacterium]|nr:ATP-binding protein [Candidatus Polarisedimenticolaceae bacterium]